MPYDTNTDLPDDVRLHLPEHAQTIYREAFNHAWISYRHDPQHEEIAHRVAWAAVKKTYFKQDQQWVAKSQARQADRA